MKKEIEVLIKLQKLDNLLKSAITKKAKLPEVIKELETKFNTTSESIQNVKQRLEQNVQQQRKFELNISGNNQDINKYERQLLTVKTNKEYKALNSEITHRKEKNTQIEEQLIELMESEDVLSKEKEQFEESFKKDTEILEQEKDKINQEIKKLKKEISELEQQKAKVSKNISETLFKRYQLLIQHKDGKAIASIDNAVCSGCHLRIRPQILVEVAKQDSIIICESCSRILIPPQKTAKEN